MRRTQGSIALAALVVVLAGCSDSSEPEAEASAEASASASASESPSTDESGTPAEELPETSEGDVPTEVAEGVLARLDAAEGLMGTAATDTAPPVLDLAEFNEGAPAAQRKALEKRGFVGAAYEQVQVPDTVGAVRIVLGFDSPAGAAADVKAGPEDLPGEGLTKLFDVPGVPGAQGFDVFGQQGLVGRNIAFSVGEYEYIIGFAADQPPSKDQPSRDEFAAVAKDWYDEVRGLD